MHMVALLEECGGGVRVSAWGLGVGEWGKNHQEILLNHQEVVALCHYGKEMEFQLPTLGGGNKGRQQQENVRGKFIVCMLPVIMGHITVWMNG